MSKRVRIATLASALILTLVAVAPNVVRADSYGTELPFVAGTGARPSALGLAATGLTGEPSLQYFNPASLAKLQYKSFEFYRTTLFDSKSQYHTFQYAHPMLDYGTLAVSVLRLDVGDIEERDIYNNLLSTDLKNAQTRVLLGYAHSLHPALAAGLNLKIDNQSFAGYSGSGVGLDLGFMATKTFTEDSFFEYVRGGLSIQNLIEPSVKLDQDDVADPLSVAFGASAVASAGRIGFVTAVDVVAPRFSPYQFRFGQEVGYADILAVRFGFDGSTPTFGLGASWRNVGVDYAFRSEDLGSNHRISLIVRFGSSLDERREAERAALEAELDRQINSKMSELESSQLSETMRRADDLFAQGEYLQAAGQYELALLWDAENELALARIETCRYHGDMARARSLMKDENYLEALYYLRQALSRSPDDTEAAALIADCNRRIQRQADHTEMIDRMLKRSIDLYATRRFIEAQAGFREILNLDPDNKLAAEYEQKSHANVQNLKHRLIVEANNRADRGDYAAAVTALKKAQRYAPSDKSLTSRIDELEAKQREAERRQEARDKAPAAPPARPAVASPRTPAVDLSLLEPKYNEGLRYFDKGNFDAAVRRFHEVWVVAPDFHNVQDLLTKAYLFIGMQKYSEENYEEAIVIWERALNVAPDNVKAKRYLQKAKEEASRLGRVNDE